MPRRRRRWITVALPLLLGGMTTTAAAQAPAPTEPSVKVLGAATWQRVAIDRRRTQLAVTTARSVRVLALPSRQLAWERPTTAGPLLIAFSADGKSVAWIEPELGTYRFVELRVADGAPVATWSVPMLSVPRTGGRHRDQNTPAPSALVGAPDGNGWWLINAYGVHQVLRGATGPATRIEQPGVTGATRVGQDGSLWGWDERGAYQIGTNRRAPRLPGSIEALDASLQRMVMLVGEPQQPKRLQLRRLDDGELEAEFPLAAIAATVLILDENHLLVRSIAPGLVGWLGKGQPVRWEGGAGPWRRIELSPSGKRAVGVSAAGELQVIDLPSGRILADNALLYPTVAQGVGFDGEDTLWAIGPENTLYFGKTSLVRLDLKTGKVVERRALDFSMMVSVAPLWLPRARAFVITSVTAPDDGVSLVPVTAGKARTRLFAEGHHFGTGFSAIPDGTRVLIIDHEAPTLFVAAAADPARLITQVQLPKLQRAVLVGEQIALLPSDGTPRWNLLGSDGRPLGSLGELGFSDSGDGQGTILVLARRHQLDVVDMAQRRPLARFVLPDETPAALRLLPGARQLLLGGGATGWRLIDLPQH